MAEVKMGTHLIDSDDFTACLLDLTSLLQKVPESRLCDLLVRCEYAHSVEFGDLVIFSGKFPSNDLVLVKSRHPSLHFHLLVVLPSVDVGSPVWLGGYTFQLAVTVFCQALIKTYPN